MRYPYFFDPAPTDRFSRLEKIFVCPSQTNCFSCLVILNKRFDKNEKMRNYSCFGIQSSSTEIFWFQMRNSLERILIASPQYFLTFKSIFTAQWKSSFNKRFHQENSTFFSTITRKQREFCEEIQNEEGQSWMTDWTMNRIGQRENNVKRIFSKSVWFCWTGSERGDQSLTMFFFSGFERFFLKRISFGKSPLPEEKSFILILRNHSDDFLSILRDIRISPLTNSNSNIVSIGVSLSFSKESFHIRSLINMKKEIFFKSLDQIELFEE